MQIARCVAILWTLAFLSPDASVAWAQQSSSAGSAGALVPVTKFDGAWSTVLAPSSPGAATAPLPPAWSKEEVEAARARCAALLKGLDLVAVAAESIHEVRDGDTCGTPAPMQLVSIGSGPQITFSPPPMLNCDMIAALHKWLTRDVQPLARKHLGVPVVGIKTMSSFSCRNAYSRAKTRLSEHGRVNALDIGAFLTAHGEATQVVADWGPSARELADKAAAAQAEAVKRQAEAAAGARKSKAPAAKTPAEGPRLATPDIGKAIQANPSIALPMPRVTFGLRGSDDGNDLSTGLGWAPPSRLGGPKEEDAPAPSAGGKAAFLRAIHKAACDIFSTVLGPEANRDHFNHFHLDLAERKSATICK
jgi:hypothetical protein